MDYVTAIAPSLGVLFLFVLAIRAIFQADHRERLAQAQLERREQAEPIDPDGPTRTDPGRTKAAGGLARTGDRPPTKVPDCRRRRRESVAGHSCRVGLGLTL